MECQRGIRCFSTMTDFDNLTPDMRIAAVAVAIRILKAGIAKDPALTEAYNILNTLVIAPTLLAVAQPVGPESPPTLDATTSDEPAEPDSLPRLVTLSKYKHSRDIDPAGHPQHQCVSLAGAPNDVKIGKLANSHILFFHDDVARMHAVLERVGEGWRVIDLGSRCGTTVNGMVVTTSLPVKAGDVLGFGECTLTIEAV